MVPLNRVAAEYATGPQGRESCAAEQLATDSKAQPDQLRAVSIGRLKRALGWVPAELTGELDEALRLHLAL
ncbi:type II toxin-antitoxin system PemK/MazF family toxin [Humibacter ginsenosidimutans]|uniref:Type II toxin-antitoxin system PemK/MazF family toxin n=1 Tax=Humibacter ginsenosidimutans TaxID=2599293 RepID=A0A5B8M0I2_9MICO|nr:type II toxin-antitoxin system PemK/MazF family toxin [Humibacter ginsenosidimutans]QDZ13434.1 type II toxin-antitoxin system PemK/MazF family toxin [Humibacter ginsenosidimutans]